MTLQRAAILAGAIMLHANLNLAYADDWLPDLALIAKVEANLVLPQDAYPINQYTRYYFNVPGKTRTLGARFLHTKFTHMEQSGVQIVKESDAPGILDGGCYMLNFRYDADAGKVLALFCNSPM